MALSTRQVTYTSSRYLRANRWDRRNLDIARESVDPRPGEQVLEVGCGRGHLVKALREEGVEAVGADLNDHVVAHGVSEALQAAPGHDLPYDDGRFDVVLSFHMIEHVPDVDAVLAELVRVLRPGGRLLLVYPAEPVRGAYAVGASFVMYGHPFAARRIHRHTVRPSSLEPRLTALGLHSPQSRFRLLTTPQFQTVAHRPGAQEPTSTGSPGTAAHSPT
jgi:ubiquinone/menaquinone biosynthesis C-methylase UbiE